LLAATAWVPSAPAQDLALVGGTVIPATGGPPIANATVVVENGRIVAVGPRAATPVPNQATVIDVTDKWITPGLVDSNVHLILMTVPEFFVKYEDRLVDIAIQSAQVGLKYGMTTMADSWGPLAPLLEARDRINAGEFAGSRVLIAGNIVGLGGPFSAYFMGSWPLRGLDLRYSGWVHPDIQRRIDRLWEDDVGPSLLAMTPDEAAEAMRRYIAKGVDFVKVAVSGHGIPPVEPLLFSPAVLHAMREEVRDAGIPFQTHSFTVESLRLAVELEPELLQHPNVMSTPWKYATEGQRSATTALIDEIARKGIYAGLMAIPEREQMRIYEEWDPTENNEDPILNQIMLGRKIGLMNTSFEERAEPLRLWLESGVRYTLATDQGPDAADLGPVAWGRLGRAHFDRMQGLQDSGATPMDILIAATRHGAEAYGLGNEVGTVEVGKLADLLVLDADPLADIANMRAIHMVIQRGLVVDRESLPTVHVLDYDPEAPWPR
jgi:imidazolonepropionase-like amidohydrolase